MSRNIESIERNQPHAALLLDVCRRMPDTFIFIGELQMTFGWSFVSTLTAVGDARQYLKKDALYTISNEQGIVYEPTRVAVGERIIPSGLRPDPTWLSEFPERRDLTDLLQRLRFAKAESYTSAAPPLTPEEYMLLIRFVADSVQHKVSSASELSEALRVLKDTIYVLVSTIAQKLTAETRGEWEIGKERRGGVCYILEHNAHHLR